MRSRRVPHNNLLRRVGRLVFLRLQVAHEQRRHEEGSREDEKQFGGSNGKAGQFQSTLYSKALGFRASACAIPDAKLSQGLPCSHGELEQS